VAGYKIPIKIIEGTGLRARLLFHFIGASFAIIRHAVDIGPACRIRLGAQQAAIGILAHAERVGRFHPFIGVGIDRKIPFMQLLRAHSGEKREGTGEHQALNVMGIGFFDGLADRRFQAGQLRVAGPVKTGQGALGAQRIGLDVAGHALPVNAAHIFAPADDLTDEAFGGVERHTPGFIFGFCRLCRFERIEEARIHID
jgi:hypothetical protein